MKSIHLTTPRLTIRPLLPKDVAPFHEYRSDKEVLKYQGMAPMDEQQCLSFIEEMAKQPFGRTGEWVQYAIARSEDDLLVGDCAIRLLSPDPRMGEIGITISPKHQQKGYAKEAMQAILQFLFEEKALHRVQETVDAENEASIRLLESLGFRQEGHFIENIWFNGKWGSEYQYAMLRTEWIAA